MEFAEHLDQISLGAATTGVNTVQSSTVMGSSGMASQTIMASREMSTHTVSGRSSRISASATATSTVASSTVMGSGTMNTVHDQTEVGSIRFVEALLNVSTAFVSSINPFEQANSVLNQIVKLFAAERGYLFTNDEQTGELSLLTGKGADGSTLTQLTGYSRTVVRKANETGKAVLVSGTDEAEAIGSESAVLHNLRSIIATPLIAKDKVVGVVYLDSKLTKGLFSQGDVELFSTLANHIGVALELSRSANMEREQAKLRHQLDIQTAVSAEATKVKVLADNMQQALFSIEKGGTIVEPVSKFTEHLLGGKIVGKNLLDVLYRNLPRDDKQKFDGVQNALNMVFGEDELQWDLISDQFPHECTHSDKTERILKVQPSPIWSNEQTVEKIVFVVEDVTQMEEMKRQIQNQQVQAAMLEEMLKSDLKEVSNFINGISSTIVTMKAAAGETTLAGLADLLRDVHTLKGNARLYKMINLSKQVHESESVIVPLKGKGELVDADRQLIAAELGKIAAMIGSYKKISDQLFNSSSKESSTGAINAFALGALKKAIDQFDQSTADEQVYKVRRAFDRLQFKSVADLTSQYKPMVMDISAQLGKMVNLQVEGEALVSVDQASVLKDCLLHLLRNSIDHGLETTEDRVKSNKAEAGTVKVSCHDDGETVVIAISDDGRGIDVDRVASVAVERGLLTREQADGMSHDQKLDLIFLDGFSSKSEATDISGRGIGMSVVRESLSRMGASLKLDTKLGAGTSFTITLTQKVQGVELAA